MGRNQILSNFVYPILTSIIGGLILSYLSLLIPLKGEYDIDYIWLWTRVLSVFIISSTIILFFITKYRRKTKPIKVVVFDFDGTLTYNHGLRSSWEKIWVYLGYKVQDCQKYYDQLKKGKIDHQEWCDITCEAFKNKNLTRNVLDSINDSFKKIIVVKDHIMPRRNEEGILTIGLYDFLLKEDSLDM